MSVIALQSFCKPASLSFPPNDAALMKMQEEKNCSWLFLDYHKRLRRKRSSKENDEAGNLLPHSDSKHTGRAHSRESKPNSEDEAENGQHRMPLSEDESENGQHRCR